MDASQGSRPDWSAPSGTDEVIARRIRGRLPRRRFLASALGAAGGLLAGSYLARAQEGPVLTGPTLDPESIRHLQPDVPVTPDGSVGLPTTGLGIRSPFVDIERDGLKESTDAYDASWDTPLQDLEGIITPAYLHHVRSRSGNPIIDPSQHRLLVHGMVDREKVYTMDELRRFPRVSHIYFLECSGNSDEGWRAEAEAVAPDDGVQAIHGQVSTSEWAGVPVRAILEDVGVQDGAEWALAEGADGLRLDRSIPVEKLLDDAMLAMWQNGEPIRPEQGYPVRLLLPGWEGNPQIKWLRRLELGSEVFQTRFETRNYSEGRDDGRINYLTFPWEAKSLITFPSPGFTVEPGFIEITGLAWSGGGRIESVEVSTDGGDTWEEARLDAPVLPKAQTRFRYPWRWDGAETVIVSRTTDETGYTQPTRQTLVDGEVYADGAGYHYNGQQEWRLHPDGTVTNVLADLAPQSSRRTAPRGRPRVSRDRTRGGAG